MLLAAQCEKPGNLLERRGLIVVREQYKRFVVTLRSMKILVGVYYRNICRAFHEHTFASVKERKQINK